MSDCIFCKIVAGEIKPDIVYQDDQVLAFKDINPQAPLHLLIIPKLHLANLNKLSDQALAGKLLQTAAQLAEELGYAESGYRTVINCTDDGGHPVHHLHVHLLAGRRLSWPPG